MQTIHILARCFSKPALQAGCDRKAPRGSYKPEKWILWNIIAIIEPNCYFVLFNYLAVTIILQKYSIPKSSPRALKQYFDPNSIANIKERAIVHNHENSVVANPAANRRNEDKWTRAKPCQGLR